MSARELLAEVARFGGTLTRDGDVLRVRAPEPLPDELMARLRANKPDLLRLLADEQHESAAGEKATLTNYGNGYRHPDGRVETGQPEPMPRPVVSWPADLDGMLRRVSAFYEWTQADRADFTAWARRSPDGMAEARAFLQGEAAKLPAPGLSDRRRVVLDMLAVDPALRVAWTCEDRGEDPVVLVLAIHNKGAVELAIPRERLDALALPQLIDQLSRDAGE